MDRDKDKMLKNYREDIALMQRMINELIDRNNELEAKLSEYEAMIHKPKTTQRTNNIINFRRIK